MDIFLEILLGGYRRLRRIRLFEKRVAGLLILVASVLGGLLFGRLADRITASCFVARPAVSRAVLRRRGVRCTYYGGQRARRVCIPNRCRLVGTGSPNRHDPQSP